MMPSPSLSSSPKTRFPWSRVFISMAAMLAILPLLAIVTLFPKLERTKDAMEYEFGPRAAIERLNRPYLMSERSLFASSDSSSDSHMFHTKGTGSSTNDGMIMMMNGRPVASSDVIAHDFESTRKSLPAAQGIPSTLAFSILSWVRIGHVTSSPRCIAAHGGPEGRWMLTLLPAGNVKLTIILSPGQPMEFTTTIPVTVEDGWTHIGAVYDSDAATSNEAGMFINGVSAPFTAPRVLPTGAGSSLNLHEFTFTIGQCLPDASSVLSSSDSQQDATALFPGALADLQLWDRALPGYIIQQLAAKLKGSESKARESSNQLFSLSSGDYGKYLRSTKVPTGAVLEGNDLHEMHTKSLSAYSACTVKSPAEFQLQSVAKTASVTVMAWVLMAKTPEKKEACIVSHGSWERGYKLSIIPFLNVQFSVKTISGEVLDFFSMPISPSLNWQHIAVTYNAEDASVAFYANGFPLEMDSVPKVAFGKAHDIIPESVPFTIGRCVPDDENDEPLSVNLADVMLWEGVLDYQAIRSLLHGAAAAPGAINQLKRALPERRLILSLPPVGCMGRPGALPLLPTGMEPPAPTPPSLTELASMQRLLLDTVIILSVKNDVHSALRVLDSVDSQATSMLRGAHPGFIPTIIVAPDSSWHSTASVSKEQLKQQFNGLLEGRYSRLDVALYEKQDTGAKGSGGGMSYAPVHSAATVVRELLGDSLGSPDKAVDSAAAQWVLLMNENLKPLEHWLEHLVSTALVPTTAGDSANTFGQAASEESGGAFSSTSKVMNKTSMQWLKKSLVGSIKQVPMPLAVKSLTLTAGGMVKSAGLRHYLTVVGDGHVLPTPFMVMRGYKASYIRALEPGKLAAEVEATTCESLLIDAITLINSVDDISEDMSSLYSCASLTAPLAHSQQLSLSEGSWVLELQPAKESDRWDASGDSMTELHSQNKHSLLEYVKEKGGLAMQHINKEIELNLTVKWMFACGGSWAWEAANLVEHLERKIPLRVQIQSPFQYCGGHNVLSGSPLSFAERIVRMVDLPALPYSDGSYHPLPKGTNFEQDDVIIYHRDYFRASNWHNWMVRRPKYMIGRYMNEATGVHARVVQQCNELDEIWVPSKHHIEIYAGAGVEREKLVVIPESIDPLIFNPETVEPMILPGRKSFVFISIFKFEERKNWKQLIWAYCKAFTASDDVSLYIHTNLRGKFDAMDDITKTINEYIEEAVLDGSTSHTDTLTLPHWQLTGKPLTTESMISFYKAGNCYALPTHGEGWGLPYMEAMSMGLPAIGTNWGGNLEFMNSNNSYLVNVKRFEESDRYDDWMRNFHWAQPDEVHFSQLMQDAYFNKAKSESLGRQARLDVIKHFSNKVVAQKILDRLKIVQQKIQAREAAATPPKPPLGIAYQWTIASDVKLCATMPSSKLLPGRQRQLIHSGDRTITAANNSITIANKSSDIISGSTQPRKLLRKPQPTVGLSAGVKCPSRPIRLAFITPFLPRSDGLSYYAANLRNSVLKACPDITIDVFAIVYDFWSAYSEPYNPDRVRQVIFRESFNDYEAAAAVINAEYDAALINFKLGALGGTAGAYSVCFAKSLTVPLVTITHSIHHAMSDELQFNLMQLLAESDAAVVMSDRARLNLDTAAGFIPSDQVALKNEAVVVIPNGAPAQYQPTKQRKDRLKEELGLSGKRVMITLGLQGPDKGVEHVLRGIDRLPRLLVDSMVYIVAGEPADCGATCIEFYESIEIMVEDLNLTSSVVLMPEPLTRDAWNDVMAAADIQAAIYPEDLFPHPSTYVEALANGVVPVATPFAAALSYMDEKSGVLVYKRDPDNVAAALRSVLELSDEQLLDMQRAAFEAASGKDYDSVAAKFVEQVIKPVVNA